MHALTSVFFSLLMAGPLVAEPVAWRYQVVESYPQDPGAFTQGLFYEGNTLVLGTGLHGASSLRFVDLATGRTLRKQALDSRYFGEGVVRHGNLLYQLTWKAGVAFTYDARTLEPVGQFRYRGQGWGLSSDGTHLVMSDGSATLTGRRPGDFSVAWTRAVTLSGRPLPNLNELEYINGRIYANVFQENYVVVIDPADGVVEAVIDFSPLVGAMRRAEPRSGVLNGLAWDARRGLLLVTGKNWNRLHAVRLAGE